MCLKNFRKDIALLCLSFIAILSTECINGASPVKTVEGTFTYYGDRMESPAECKLKAAQMARIEALKEFGTIISHNTFSSQSESMGKSQSKFLSLSESETKGEWLSDIGEPKYTVSFSDDDCLVVTCQIKGQARALSNEAEEFEALVLRNGNERKNADNSFKNDDDLYVYFCAPTQGYVAVFLQDENGDVYSLLPYPHSHINRVHVKKGYDYVFFDSKRAGNDFGTVEPIGVTATERDEFNKVYVLFSPNEFSLPPMRFTDDENLPPVTDGEAFSKWLVKARRNDPKMGVKSTLIRISPS